MTRRTNARVAGFTFLFYIVAGITSLVLRDHAQATAVLTVFTSLSALVLGVTLYALTRDQDPDLALLGLVCRVVEAVPGGEAVSALFFAIGSTVFSWLFLRGRMIPTALAWLGVIASASMAVILLLQRAGLGTATNWSSAITWILWLPLLVFEVTFASWLILKGVAPPAPRRAP